MIKKLIKLSLIAIVILATVHAQTISLADAEIQLQKRQVTLDGIRGMIKKTPDNNDLKIKEIDALVEVADSKRTVRQPGSGLADYQLAVALLNAQLLKKPNDPVLLNYLGDVMVAVASIRDDTKSHSVAEAVKARQAIAELRGKLSREFPLNLTMREKWASSLDTLGLAKLKNSQREEAEVDMDRALELLEANHDMSIENGQNLKKSAQMYAFAASRVMDGVSRKRATIWINKAIAKSEVLSRKGLLISPEEKKWPKELRDMAAMVAKQKP